MLNFNTQPYYDDFNEDKNFHRILFKPGAAVQARELTQAQSILQDQIGKFGKFVLSDGSNVSGGKYTLNTNVKSLNLKNIDSIATDIEFFTEMFVVGSQSKCVGLITSCDILNYYMTVKSLIRGEVNFISEETLYIFSSREVAYAYRAGNETIITNKQYDYTAKLNIDQNYPISGCFGQKDSYTFTIPTQTISIGNIITVASENYNTNYIVTEIGYDGTFKVHRQLTSDFNNVSVNVAAYASNYVLEVSFSDGVYFTNNTFVKALPQSIIPNLTTQYPSCCIGFEVVETVVDYIDDTSLLDPAQGSYNYTAPGADRYKIYLNLVSKPLINGGIDQTTLTNSKFIELLRIKNGTVVYDNTSPVLGGLEDVLAAQMYDHAGNFIVTPFNISFSDSNFTDAATTLNAVVSSGKAYVYGYPYNATFPTYLSLDKARETANSLNNITSTYYGNSVRISDASGKLPIPSLGSRVEIHSVSKNQSKTNETRLGYAYVGNIDYTTTNEYSLYLYNLTISDQKLAMANSIVGANFAANTILTSGVNVVTDSKYNKLLFKLPYSNPSSIFDASLTLDKFTTISVSSSTAILETYSGNKQFSCGVNTNIDGLPLSTKNENFILVAKTTNGAYSSGEYIDLADVVIKVQNIGDNYRATFTFLNSYTGSIDVKYSIYNTAPAKKVKNLQKNKIVQIDCKTTPTSLGYSDIATFKGVFKAPINSAVYIPGSNDSWEAAIAYDQYNVVKFGDKLYISTISSNSNNSPPSNPSNWKLLENTKINYKLDNGQKEFFYDHGTISSLSAANVGKLFVLFDYYTHSSGEYIAFNSYPNGYRDIASVKINNTIYDLKDYIDFRPRRKDSSDATMVLYDDYTIPSTITDSRFYYDMSYYLGRIDKLILTGERKLQWFKGVSSYKNYIPPKDDVNGMTIATIQFDPYTPDAKSIKINYSKHRRYTMDDIGTLDTRLTNVEYYTALTMGEKTALGTNIVDEYGTRLKNGFIVDSFTNLTVVDLSTNDRNVSIDLVKNLARPAFDKREYSQITASKDEFANEDLNLKIYPNGLVSFKSARKPIIVQDQATGYVKINQFDSISYKGDLYLTPQSQVFPEQSGANVPIINEDTAAIVAAKTTPGLVFNDWQTFYSNTTDYKIEEGSTSEVTYGKSVYSVSTAIVGKATETHKDLISAIVPKTKQTTINFRATGLAPFTRMYVYIANRLVSGYVTPDHNPMGIITGVAINSGGIGYSAGATAVLTSAANVTATFKLNVTGGVIDSVTITNIGAGYTTSGTTKHTLTITDSTHTTTAELVAVTNPKQGTYLYTDASGECSGSLTIPNNDMLSFDAGELLITVCSTPHYDIANALSCAQAIYYSKYAFFENIVTSIRKPYIKKIRDIPDPPVKPRVGQIIVPSKISYTFSDYKLSYAQTKSGILTIPIYLSGDAPTSDVIVTYNLNASHDQPGAVEINSATPSQFTFTPSNYTTKQDLVINYNLNGTVPSNKLASYIEFYAASSDPVYNYAGIVKPAESWTKNYIIGTATTNLSPIVITDPNPITKQEQINTIIQQEHPKITVTNCSIPNEKGTGSIVVTYSGTDIGWHTASTTTYPLQFTAELVENNSGVTITSSEYQAETTNKDLQTGSTRQIKQFQNEYLSFMFNLYGVAQGTYHVKVTIHSNNPNWEGLNATSTVTVGAAIVPPVDPNIIVWSNNNTSPTIGELNNPPRTTHSKGGSNIIGITLNKAPTGSVLVKANSSLMTGGGDVVTFSNNFTDYALGNTVTFTASNWDKLHSFVALGYDNLNNESLITTPYFIDLKASASNPADSGFVGLSKRIPITNTDYAEAIGEPILTILGTKTTGNGSIISVSVALTSPPLGNDVVRVMFESNNTTTGGIIITGSVYGANGIFQFTNSNYGVPQTLQIQGAPLSALDSGDDVKYILKCTSEKWDTVNNKKIASEWTNEILTDLINSPYIYRSTSVTTTRRTKRYEALCLGRDPKSWTPDMTQIQANIQPENNRGTIVSYQVVGPWIDVAQNALKYTANFTGKISAQRSSSTKVTQTNHADLTISLDPKFYNNVLDTMFVNPKITCISAYNMTSLKDVTGSIKIDTAASAGSNSPTVPARGGFFAVIPYTGKNGTEVQLVTTFYISGIYFDAIAAGFKVSEYVDQEITTTYYRTDTYEQIGVPDVKTITGTGTDVDWKSSPESVLAAYNVIANNRAYDAILPQTGYNLRDRFLSKGVFTSDIRVFEIETLKSNLQNKGIFIEKIKEKIINSGGFSGNIDPKLKTAYTKELNDYNNIILELNTLGLDVAAAGGYTVIPLVWNPFEYTSSINYDSNR
jgi:hypothetical protein